MELETMEDYYRSLYQYQSVQLLYEAINLDVFSFMNSPITSAELSEATGYNEKNLELLLFALFSCGHLIKNGAQYCNTKPSAEYLAKSSPHYIGEALVFRETMTSLHGIGEKVRRGVCEAHGADYDFATLARVSASEMYATGRVETFLSELCSIFPDQSSRLRMLDLGGGSGILAVEFAKRYPNGQSSVFERPSVAEAAKEIISQRGMQKRVWVVSGDFNVDDIGDGYNLVVASGVLEFAASLPLLVKKISNSLVAGGYLLLIGCCSEEDGYPQENIVSWLSGYMNGVCPPPAKKCVEAALLETGLLFVRGVDSGRFKGGLYQKKESAHEHIGYGSY